MSRKLVLLIVWVIVLIGMLASIILFLFPLRVNGQSEQWIPYVPYASQVGFDYWGDNGTSYMNVSIWFSSSGYNVSDWGTPIIVGNNVSVDAEIWDWTGVDLQVMTLKSHAYNIGDLPAIEHSFIFKAWGSPVKDTTFFVPEFPSFLILPLFMITTLLAVMVYRRKHTV